CERDAQAVIERSYTDGPRPPTEARLTMFIELVDSLRCLEAHDETWLVAAASRMAGRHPLQGGLGVPVCPREYAVRDGTAWFSARQPDAADRSLTTIAADSDPAHLTRT